MSGSTNETSASRRSDALILSDNNNISVIVHHEEYSSPGPRQKRSSPCPHLPVQDDRPTMDRLGSSSTVEEVTCGVEQTKTTVGSHMHSGDYESNSKSSLQIEESPTPSSETPSHGLVSVDSYSSLTDCPKARLSQGSNDSMVVIVDGVVTMPSRTSTQQLLDMSSGPNTVASDGIESVPKCNDDDGDAEREGDGCESCLVTENCISEVAENDVTDDFANNATDDITNYVTYDVTNDVTDNVMNDVADDVTKDVTNDITNDATNDVTDDVTNDVTDDVTNDVTDDATNDVADDITNDITDDVTNDITDEVTNDVTNDGKELIHCNGFDTETKELDEDDNDRDITEKKSDSFLVSPEKDGDVIYTTTTREDDAIPTSTISNGTHSDVFEVVLNDDDDDDDVNRITLPSSLIIPCVDVAKDDVVDLTTTDVVDLLSTDCTSEMSSTSGGQHSTGGAIGLDEGSSNSSSRGGGGVRNSGTIGDELVESILDDDETESKMMRPRSLLLASSSFSVLQGSISGSSTPIGRSHNFGTVTTDDVDLDGNDFVEINLSGNLESKMTGNKQEPVPAGLKMSKFGSFLTRSFSLKKTARENDTEDTSLGWKLFGRVPPKQAPSHNHLPEILNEFKTKGGQGQEKPSDDKIPARRSTKEVPSTTALILQRRPSGLPSKDPEEEQKHQMMYEEMIEAARKKEQKEAKLRKKQREQQIKHEEELSFALKIWNMEILPCWETAKNSKKTQELWWKGIPPSVRGKVWKLAIGNDLNVTSELYEICVIRARDKLKILQDADTDSLSSNNLETSANRESSVDLIQLDVSRTFPQLCIFQSGGPYHKLLQGLLGAYVCYRPDVGYVQGMSFLAAVLLLNMDVVESFICFANLLNKPCEVAFFRLDEFLMKAYFDTYETVFKENLQKLHAHFENLHISPDLYIIDWMYTIFAKSLPLDVASRVWDVFFRDGEEFLFRTALGILKLYEDILMNLDFIHLVQFLTRLPDNISSSELFRCIEQIHMHVNKCSFTQVLAKNREQTRLSE